MEQVENAAASVAPNGGGNGSTHEGTIVVKCQSSTGRVAMTNNQQASLYVGELAPSVVESALFEKFSAIGPVLSVRICRDSVTKASLGYGYVNFSKPTDAERALDELNFVALEGRPLRLMWSQRDPSLRRSGTGNIFIKNLDKDIDNKALHDTFSCFGPILSAKVATTEAGQSKGFAFVHFANPDNAADAISKVNGKLLNGKMVFVAPHKSRAARVAEVGGPGGAKSPKFTQVYLKNFPKDMDEAGLKALGAEYGNLSVTFLAPSDADSAAGEVNKGWGMLTYDTAEAAADAVEGLSGRALDGGGKLWAGRAKKREERAAEKKAAEEMRRRESARRCAGLNLYFKNVEEDLEEERLQAHFAAFGPLSSFKLMRDDAGQRKGFGFACFTTAEAAAMAAKELNGKILLSKPLYVAPAQRKEERRVQLAMAFQRAQAQGLGLPPGAPIPGRPGLYTSTFSNNGSPYSGLFPPVATPSHSTYSASPHFLSSARLPRTASAALQPAYGAPNPQAYGNTNFMPGTRLHAAAPATSYSIGAYSSHLAANPTASRLAPPRPFGAAQARSQPQYQPTSANITGGGSGSYALHFNQGARNRPGQGGGKLSGIPVGEQKQILGEELFNAVSEMVDGGSVGKVTGMLLEMPNEDIVTMLHAPGTLQAKVAEALAVLHEAGIKP